MKKFFSEFKEFAIKGNALDLAIGVIIGAAFKAIVDSIVNDIIMPFMGILLGGKDFSGMAFNYETSRCYDFIGIKGKDIALYHRDEEMFETYAETTFRFDDTKTYHFKIEVKNGFITSIS